MATLLEDIHTQSAWVVKAFRADRLKLDYSIGSFKKIDEFFDLHTKDGKAVPGGRLSSGLGPILFSIGSYVGETIIKNIPGSVWQTDDNDPEGEITASVKFPDGAVIWPMQKVMKRFQNGSEDGIYAYGYFLTKDYLKDNPDQAVKKPWWKFW